MAVRDIPGKIFAGTSPVLKNHDGNFLQSKFLVIV